MNVKSNIAYVCSLLLSLFSVPDVDECVESPAACDGQDVCDNTLGSYKCVCPPGYRGNGTHCEGKQLVLTSLRGKFWFLWTGPASLCACVLILAVMPSIKIMSGRIMFTDWNELSFKKLTVCTRFPDENECASGGHGCDTNARCGNIIGSYFCQCYQGFNGDGHSCFGG